MCPPVVTCIGEAVVGVGTSEFSLLLPGFPDLSEEVGDVALIGAGDTSDAGVEGDLDNEIGFNPYTLASQGDIYEFVLDGLHDMAARLGEQGVFIGPAPSATMTGFLQRHGFEPVRTLATAEKALDLIVEQGEGGSADSVDSHFHRFAAILNEYETMKRDDPGFEPAFPVTG